MIKEKNSEFKDMLTGLGVFFLYLIMMSSPNEFLLLFGKNYNNLSLLGKQVYLTLYECFLLSIIVFIYRKDVIPNFKDYIKNIISYLKKYIKYWFIIIVLMILSSELITMFTTTNTSENQRIIIEEFKKVPIYMLIATILIAPILEELVFRLSFKKIFKHTNILFILFSGFMFGFIHVIGSLTSLIDLLFIIPYSIPGFIFAYTYSKSNNIFVPISIHLLHNLIMLLIQVL